MRKLIWDVTTYPKLPALTSMWFGNRDYISNALKEHQRLILQSCLFFLNIINESPSYLIEKNQFRWYYSRCLMKINLYNLLKINALSGRYQRLAISVYHKLKNGSPKMSKVFGRHLGTTPVVVITIETNITSSYFHICRMS